MATFFLMSFFLFYFFLFYFPFHSMYFNYLFHLDEVIIKDQEIQFYNCITQFVFTPMVKHTRKDVATSSFESFSPPKVEEIDDNVGNPCIFIFFHNIKEVCYNVTPSLFIPFFHNYVFVFTTMFLCL